MRIPTASVPRPAENIKQRVWVCTECGHSTYEGTESLQPSIDPRWRLRQCCRPHPTIYKERTW